MASSSGAGTNRKNAVGRTMVHREALGVPL